MAASKSSVRTSVVLRVVTETAQQMDACALPSGRVLRATNRAVRSIAQTLAMDHVTIARGSAPVWMDGQGQRVPTAFARNHATFGGCASMAPARVTIGGLASAVRFRGAKSIAVGAYAVDMVDVCFRTLTRLPLSKWTVL